MTRQEIQERARQIGDEVEIASTNDEWNLIVERNLLSLVRATLEESARAVCEYCDRGIQLSERDDDVWWHVDDYGPCHASEIHDLIAALDKEGS